MSTKSKKQSATSPRRPEKKWGPFHGGVGLAVWLNEVDTPEGKRWYRSVTLNSRRYRDEKSGNWEDAKSFRPTDLSGLMLAMEAALAFCHSTPLPGQAMEGEEIPVPSTPENGEIPF